MGRKLTQNDREDIEQMLLAIGLVARDVSFAQFLEPDESAQPHKIPSYIAESVVPFEDLDDDLRRLARKLKKQLMDAKEGGLMPGEKLAKPQTASKVNPPPFLQNRGAIPSRPHPKRLSKVAALQSHPVQVTQQPSQSATADPENELEQSRSKKRKAPEAAETPIKQSSDTPGTRQSSRPRMISEKMRLLEEEHQTRSSDVLPRLTGPAKQRKKASKKAN